MPDEHHDWRVHCGSQVKDFDHVVRASCRYHVLILVEVHRQDITIVGVNLLDVLSSPEIPYSAVLITRG